MRSHFTSTLRTKLGLLLVAAIAIGMLPAASASAALPRFSGTFPDTFTLTSGAVTLESTGGGGIIGCGGAEGSGSITGAKTGTLSSLTFTHCGAACVISITTTELDATPVYTNKAERRVALLLKPKTGTTLATTKCYGVPREIRGSILAHVAPINEMKTRYTLESSGSRGIQTLREYENETGEKVHVTLESNIFFGEFFGLSMSFTQNLTMAHAITLEA